jgi:PTH2 family peptidyl-tRNA hydrolase
LVAPNTEKLLFAYEQARDLNLPCCLIEDSGHILPPHFLGQPIVTAMGIGPARRDEVRDITKRFKSL